MLSLLARLWLIFVAGATGVLGAHDYYDYDSTVHSDAPSQAEAMQEWRRRGPEREALVAALGQLGAQLNEEDELYPEEKETDLCNLQGVTCYGEITGEASHVLACKSAMHCMGMHMCAPSHMETAGASQSPNTQHQGTTLACPQGHAEE